MFRQMLFTSSLVFGVPNEVQTSRVTGTACHQIYMKPGRRGQRCITGTEVYRNYTDVPQERCMWHCLRDLYCKFINYNDVGSYCLLGHGPCVSMEPDNDFVTNTLTMEEPCLVWVRQDTIPPSTDSTSIIKFRMFPDSTDENTAMVARAVLGSQRIVGRYRTGNAAGYYTFNGQVSAFSAGNYEVLTLSPRCKASWVSYDSESGNALPDGSVIGGSHNGEPLYVVQKFSSPDNAYVVGYYSHRDRFGQLGSGSTVITFTTMKLLVVN